MSDKPQSIERDLIGDWFMFGGMVIAFLNYSRIRWLHRPLEANQPLGVRILAGSSLAPVATIELFADTGTSRLIITPASGHEEGMRQLADLLHETSMQAEDMRRAWTPSADEVIERYYRSRAAGRKVTLRQLAEEAELSYDALRKRKQAYDKEGRWGSGRKK